MAILTQREYVKKTKENEDKLRDIIENGNFLLRGGSNVPLLPGSLLREVLMERAILVLTRMTGIPEEFVKLILVGKKKINEELAAKLETGTGISRSYWRDLQVLYDIQSELDLKWKEAGQMEESSSTQIN